MYRMYDFMYREGFGAGKDRNLCNCLLVNKFFLFKKARRAGHLKKLAE